LVLNETYPAFWFAFVDIVFLCRAIEHGQAVVADKSMSKTAQENIGAALWNKDISNVVLNSKAGTRLFKPHMV